jgi:hypothetical protein
MSFLIFAQLFIKVIIVLCIPKQRKRPETLFEPGRAQATEDVVAGSGNMACTPVRDANNKLICRDFMAEELRRAFQVTKEVGDRAHLPLILRLRLCGQPSRGSKKRRSWVAFAASAPLASAG